MPARDALADSEPATGEQVTVAIGLNADDWIRNLRTLLAELRGAAVVRDPRRVVFGPVSAGAATTATASSKRE